MTTEEKIQEALKDFVKYSEFIEIIHVVDDQEEMIQILQSTLIDLRFQLKDLKRSIKVLEQEMMIQGLFNKKKD